MKYHFYRFYISFYFILFYYVDMMFAEWLDMDMIDDGADMFVFIILMYFQFGITLKGVAESTLFEDVRNLAVMHLRGEVRCVLCLRTVVYSDGSQFEDHMRQSHGAEAEAGNLDIILAVCFMDAEEREAVKNIIFEKIIKSEAETEYVCEIVMVDEDTKDDSYENDTIKKILIALK